eukprot:1136454-Pelagomonas_calceolata.AAC.1
MQAVKTLPTSNEEKRVPRAKAPCIPPDSSLPSLHAAHYAANWTAFIALTCPNPRMNGMHTIRHHIGLGFCIEGLGKGRNSKSLIGMDACLNERFLKRSQELSLFGFSLLVLAPLPGTKVALMLSLCAPSQANPLTVILLRSLLKTGTSTVVELKFCSNTDPLPTLEAATAQHASTITRLKIRSSRNPNKNNNLKVTLHIILIGVAGTICSDYTSKPLVNLGLTRQKAESPASKFSCHAIIRLPCYSKINTSHALRFQGASGGVSAGRGMVESRRRRVQTSRSMPDNLPDPH